MTERSEKLEGLGQVIRILALDREGYERIVSLTAEMLSNPLVVSLRDS